jgi:hypothetical protein
VEQLKIIFAAHDPAAAATQSPVPASKH